MFNVKTAHFGARVLKRRPPGEGGLPKGLEIWLFQGVNTDEFMSSLQLPAGKT